MSELPQPASATTYVPLSKYQRVYHFANSRRGVSLLLVLTLTSLFYIIDVGTFVDRSPKTPISINIDIDSSHIPAWPDLGGMGVGLGTELRSKPLTSLGLEADRSFHLGSTSKAVYKAELELFVIRAFPKWLRRRAQASLDLYLSDSAKPLTFPEVPHNIFQTAKTEPSWGWSSSTWKDFPGYTYFFFDDAGADKWVREVFGGTEMEKVWDALGPGIKRSDLLRYLLVMVEGGVYSDMDTRRLKDISLWGHGANVQGRVTKGSPSMFVGVEADVGTRADWHKWWPRPLQIVQWTFSAAPLHPILIDAVRRVHHTTALIESRKLGVDPSKSNSTEERWVGGELLRDDGTVSIMEWTGPGLFTDSVIRYLAAEHEITWPGLRGLGKPVRFRDVVVLPVTGFSPGVGMFGAKETGDREAMVHHLFAGSWKTAGNDKK